VYDVDIVTAAMPDALPILGFAAAAIAMGIVLEDLADPDAAQPDVLSGFLDEVKRRGLKPGQAVESVFAPGEVDRLYPGL
jgi:hypothetical protein